MASHNSNKVGNIMQTKSLDMYHQNIISIKCKKEELVIFQNDQCNKPDIVCISDHFSVNVLFTFSMLEYKMLTNYVISI
jgi:uncharacterized protein YerC